MSAEPIVVEETYDAPIEDVWRAITDKDQMRQWYFDTMTDFTPEVGFETEFNVHFEDVDYLHRWKVTEVVPQQRIAYEFRFDGFPGNSLLSWDLSATSDGTKLRVTHQETEPFPQDDPVFSRESGQAGWEYLIHESLKDFLAR